MLRALKGVLTIAIYCAIVFGILAAYSASPILGFILSSIFVLFLLFSGGGSGPKDYADDHWWEGLRGP